MPTDDDDVDLDQARQEMALEDRENRIAKLRERGGTYDANSHTWSCEGKSYDEDGNPL